MADGSRDDSDIVGVRVGVCVGPYDDIGTVGNNVGNKEGFVVCSEEKVTELKIW